MARMLSSSTIRTRVPASGCFISVVPAHQPRKRTAVKLRRNPFPLHRGMSQGWTLFLLELRQTSAAAVASAAATRLRKATGEIRSAVAAARLNGEKAELTRW